MLIDLSDMLQVRFTVLNVLWFNLIDKHMNAAQAMKSPSRQLLHTCQSLLTCGVGAGAPHRRGSSAAACCAIPPW